MRTADSTCALFRRLPAALLGSLALLVATSVGRGDDKQPPASKPAAKDNLAKPQKDPPLVARPEASFFGTRASGKRFCIIADASNSMRGGPLAQLKKEILLTLDGLPSGSQFYVIFFNATDIPMPFPGWLDANKANVDKVRPWVEKMTTELKTLPQSSFTRAFKLDPRPDVIFFMTDGFLQGKKPDPVSHLKKLNETNPKVVVHTIMFSKQKAGAPKVEAAARQLRAMAENNGGTFRHVHHKDRR
jgi:hypothetical protein